jgi:antitoxin (DNA-binding transcriptional repressor) of toxin-antitoxin stability system
MRFLTVRDFRSKPARVWKELAGGGEMVVTSNGKPVALLSGVSEDSMEETLRTMRRAKAMAAVSAMQLRSVRTGVSRMPLSRINAVIKAARSGRK